MGEGGAELLVVLGDNGDGGEAKEVREGEELLTTRLLLIWADWWLAVLDDLWIITSKVWDIKQATLIDPNYYAM